MAGLAKLGTDPVAGVALDEDVTNEGNDRVLLADVEALEVVVVATVVEAVFVFKASPVDD